MLGTPAAFPSFNLATVSFVKRGLGFVSSLHDALDDSMDIDPPGGEGVIKVPVEKQTEISWIADLFIIQRKKQL